MNVTLTWQGPVGPGQFPEDPLVFETLCQPGIYLRIKSYDDERLVAYVGQSVSLLARFDQHLTSMMSLASPLRDSSGRVVFSGDAAARMEAYKNLPQIAALAAADTGRVRFCYALCDDEFQSDYLSLVEGLLQRRIAERLTDVENAIAAPGRMPDEVPDRWENDFSELDVLDRDLLLRLLGEEPMGTL